MLSDACRNEKRYSSMKAMHIYYLINWPVTLDKIIGSLMDEWLTRVIGNTMFLFND